MTITSDDRKAVARLEDLIHEDEPLIDREHPRYVRSQAHDSLGVDRQHHCYFWNSRVFGG